MCGLGGAVRHPRGAEPERVRSIALALLLGNEHRGRHATGMAWTVRDGATTIEKAAVPASKFLMSNRLAPLIKHDATDVTIYQGHTRHGTQNNTTRDDCAHPFAIKGIVGAHNGMIYNWHDVARTLKIEKPQVDSETIFHALAKRDTAKALSDFDGYWALTWAKQGKLWLSRTDSAQLTCVYVPAMQAMFWSSEESTLRACLREHNVVADDAQFWRPEGGNMYMYTPKKFTEKGTGVTKIKADFSGIKRAATQKELARTSGGYSTTRTWSNALEPMPRKGKNARSEKFKTTNEKLDDLALENQILEERVKQMERKFDALLEHLVQENIVPPDAPWLEDDIEVPLVRRETSLVEEGQLSQLPLLPAVQDEDDREVGAPRLLRCEVCGGGPDDGPMRSRGNGWTHDDCSWVGKMQADGVA